MGNGRANPIILNSSIMWLFDIQRTTYRYLRADNELLRILNKCPHEKHAHMKILRQYFILSGITVTMAYNE